MAAINSAAAAMIFEMVFIILLLSVFVRLNAGGIIAPSRCDGKQKIQSLDGGLFSPPWFCLWFVATKKHRRVLGEAIRQHRKRKRMSQEKLAEKADLHHNYVGEIERGEKAATIDTLVKFAKGLRVRVRDLVYDL